MDQSNSIVQNLRRIQDRYGYLNREALRELADLLSTPLHRIQEVASCFPSFRLPGPNGEENLPPRLTVKVCRDMTCHLRNAAHLAKELRAFGKSSRYTENEFAVEEVSCLGRCDRAPVVQLNAGNFVQQTADELKSIISRTFDEQAIPKPSLDADQPQHMSRWEIDVYADDADLPPYAAVRQFVQRYPAPTDLPVDEQGRNQVAVSIDDIPLLQNLKAAGLLGMGGAGMPAFKKWSDVFNADGGVRITMLST